MTMLGALKVSRCHHGFPRREGEKVASGSRNATPPRHDSEGSNQDVLHLYEENWAHSLLGTPISSSTSQPPFADFSSDLAPESPASTVSSLSSAFHTSPNPDGSEVLTLRHVNKIEPLAVSTKALPAFWASSESPTAANLTQPVAIPQKKARAGAHGNQGQLAGLQIPGDAAAKLANKAGAAAGQNSDGTLGSWTQRQVVYPIKTGAAPPQDSPDTVLASFAYGFMPAALAAMRPMVDHVPAFWPEGGDRRKGPHRTAVAEAAKVAIAVAGKPTTRIHFKAATKVDAPLRPGAAVQLQHLPPVGRPRAAKGTSKETESQELDIEEKLWRLRSKRKWIREQLHALRGGFPKDSAYDEPWSDAFDMLQATRGGLNLQAAGQRADYPGSDDDADIGSDSELHELMLFGEELPSGPIKAAPTAAAAVAGSSSTKAASIVGGSTPSMDSPVAGAFVAASGSQQAAPSKTTVDKTATLLKAGSLVWTDGRTTAAAAIPTALLGPKPPTTLFGCAEELMRHQRSIEADAQRAWQSKFSRQPSSHNLAAAAATAAGAKSGSADRAALGRQAASKRRLLRNDSAFEAKLPRAEKSNAQAGIKEESQWVGALLPAAEFDVDGAITYSMIRITDPRSGASRVILRGKGGQTEAAILKTVQERVARIAKKHELEKPRVELVRSGTMQWEIAQQDPTKAQAPEVIW